MGQQPIVPVAVVAPAVIAPAPPVLQRAIEPDGVPHAVIGILAGVCAVVAAATLAAYVVGGVAVAVVIAVALGVVMLGRLPRRARRQRRSGPTRMSTPGTSHEPHPPARRWRTAGPMIPHYRIHLPLVAIEGRAISVDGGTGVSAMIALAYVRAWSAEATVAIYPSGHRALVGRAELVAADAMLVRARACGARVLRVDAPSIAGALAAATVVYADAAALCALARAAQPALMALIDELVPAIDTAREDAALARVQRGTAPLDLDLDILARCPHLMDDHATPARLLGTRRPALRARPGAAHDRTAGALESA